MDPTSYINLQAYQVPGERVLVVTPASRFDVDVPEDAQEDPDTFEAWTLELAREHGITDVKDIDGTYATLSEWTQHGV
jgi:hypothetical protein